MKTFKPYLIILFFAGIGAFLSGCGSTDSTTARESSKIPWSRPASWEGGVPGAGALGDRGRTGY